LPPLAKMGQQCRGVVLEAIGQTQRYAAWRQALDDLMHHPLGHRQGTSPDIDHEKQFTLEIHGRPHPIRRTLQALDRLVITELTGFARS